MALILDNGELMGITAPITPAEAALPPLTDAQGHALYVVDDIDYTHQVSGYNLRQRTEDELYNLPSMRAARAAEYVHQGAARLYPDALSTQLHTDMEERLA